MGLLLLAAPSAAEESDSELRKIEAGSAIQQDPEADLSEREAPPEYLDELGLPMPCTGPWDWIRFNSGEWLRGRLYRMRRKEVEYRSKRLKKQTAKWKDVSELCLPNPTRFVLEGRRIVVGRARLRGDTLVVTGRDGNRTVERSGIVAILEGDTSEWNRWTGKVSVGVDAKSGNTDQATLTASGEVAREDRNSRAQALIRSTLGTSGGEENVNKHRAEVKFDVFFSRRFYWNAIDSSFSHDKFQNLSFRAVPTMGLGWHMFDRSSFEWDVEAAGGYQYTSYISVLPGQSPTEQDGVVRLATKLKWDIITDLKFYAIHDTVLVPTNFGLTNYHTRVELSYEITDLLSLDFTLVHDRVREPVRTSDGRLPEKDDVQTILGLALEYR
jgi:putative salt-induced outer membrane protein YdiY